MSLIIEQVFESVILTELSPKSQIDIYIQVIQSDGGNTVKLFSNLLVQIINL